MGFVGGGSNIAIVSALPLSSLLIVESIYSWQMGTLHLKFYSCLRLRFPDVETNPGPRRPVAATCRILCSNVRGLSGNLKPRPHDRKTASQTQLAASLTQKLEGRSGTSNVGVLSPRLQSRPSVSHQQ